MRPALRVACCAAAAMLWLASAARADACDPPPVSVDSTALAGADRDGLRAAVAAAFARACRWWGPGFADPLRVEVDEARGPSMALVPAWRGERGRILFRAGPVRAGHAAVTHEVVHVVAPNGNRFLAEGLAVHAHQALGGGPAHPDFGADLHGAAAAYADADLAALDRIATPAMLVTDALDGRAAYLVAGSFVRFLIDGRGLPAFRRLYDLTPLVPGRRDAGPPARWQAVYGASLETLAAEWRAALPPPAADGRR